MAKILCLETATKVCSVSIFENETLIDFIEEIGSYSHAENLAKFTDQLLIRNKISYSELDAVSVSKGPGSYTGLRIGVAFAKGLCFSKNLPLIAINSLTSLAWGAKQLIRQDEFYICPMIDARRLEVYAAILDESLIEVRATGADIIDVNSFQEYLEKNKVYFIGDGASKCRPVINHSNSNFDINMSLSSKYMGLLSYKAFLSKNFEDLAYFEPFYLKEFIAIKAKKLV